MKKLFLLLALPLMFAAVKGNAQNDNKVKPNYALAERFSPKKISRKIDDSHDIYMSVFINHVAKIIIFVGYTKEKSNASSP